MRSAADPRDELLTVARAMQREGLVVATAGNASVREGELVHITPSGLPYESMTRQELVSLDLEGRPVEGATQPSSERLVHLAIYRARPDVRAIVHTHSPYATAWSFLGEDLALDTEDLAHYAGGPVRTAPFAPTGSTELAEAAPAVLGEGSALLLSRHGVVAVADSPARALDVSRVVERQAQIAWLLRGAAR